MSAPNNMTLLEYVQQTLNALHSDQVNSIDDIDESIYVATIVQNAYFEILEPSDEWDFTKQITQLIAAGDLSSPTKMIIPNDVMVINSFQYNVTTDNVNFQYQPILYKQPLDFLRIVQARVSSTGITSNLQSVDIGNGITIFVYNNVAPSYYTSFDQETIYCDAFNSAVDDTLKQSKTEIFATMRQDFRLENTFVPNLPFNMQQLLLKKSIATAYYELRGQRHPNAEAYDKSVTQRAKFIAAKTPTVPEIARWGRRGGWYSGGSTW
jgi:hypothetical protein